MPVDRTIGVGPPAHNTPLPETSAQVARPGRRISQRHENSAPTRRFPALVLLGPTRHAIGSSSPVAADIWRDVVRRKPRPPSRHGWWRGTPVTTGEHPVRARHLVRLPT